MFDWLYSNVTAKRHLCGVCSTKVWILHAWLTVMQTIICFCVSCLQGYMAGTEVWLFEFVFAFFTKFHWNMEWKRWWSQRIKWCYVSVMYDCFLAYILYKMDLTSNSLDYLLCRLCNACSLCSIDPFDCGWSRGCICNEPYFRHQIHGS